MAGDILHDVIVDTLAAARAVKRRNGVGRRKTRGCAKNELKLSPAEVAKLEESAQRKDQTIAPFLADTPVTYSGDVCFRVKSKKDLKELLALRRTTEKVEETLNRAVGTSAKKHDPIFEDISPHRIASLPEPTEFPIHNIDGCSARRPVWNELPPPQESVLIVPSQAEYTDNTWHRYFRMVNDRKTAHCAARKGTQHIPDGISPLQHQEVMECRPLDRDLCDSRRSRPSPMGGRFNPSNTCRWVPSRGVCAPKNVAEDINSGIETTELVKWYLSKVSG